MAIPTDLFDLTGHVALVTGGGSGIGKACAAAMIRHGAKVMIGGRTVEKLTGAVEELNGLADGQPCAAVRLDVADDASAKEAVAETVAKFGGIHAVVNSAGVMCKKPTFDLTGDDVNDLYNICLLYTSPSPRDS